MKYIFIVTSPLVLCSARYNLRKNSSGNIAPAFLGAFAHIMAGADHSMEKRAGNVATFLLATSNQELYGSINVMPHYSLYRLHWSKVHVGI